MSIENKMRIHWLCWHPTPYNNFLFRNLASDPKIDLTVHFRRQAVASHPWHSVKTTGFAARFYPTFLRFDPYLIKLAMCSRNAFFVVAGWNDLTCLAVLGILMIKGKRFAFWTDTPDLQVHRPFWKKVFRHIFLKTLFYRIDVVLTTGKSGLQALKMMGCPSGKLVNFPFFVDLAKLDFQKRKSLEEIQFLTSGRLILSKGYDLIIKALAKLRNHSKKWRLVIAGNGPEYESLSDLVEELGIMDRVEFLGWIEEDHLLELQNQSHVFLHPARVDPFPVAVLEAMAAGLPVIGSVSSGSVYDRVEHGVNGFKCHAEHFDDWTSAIAFFLDHPEKCFEFGKAARRSAEKWPVNKGVEIIREIVTGGTHCDPNH